jgi:hypothetical protein
VDLVAVAVEDGAAIHDRHVAGVEGRQEVGRGAPDAAVEKALGASSR